MMASRPKTFSDKNKQQLVKMYLYKYRKKSYKDLGQIHKDKIYIKQSTLKITKQFRFVHV